MANSRDRHSVVTRCMNCGDGLVVIGPSGELEVPCNRQRCRKGGITTPIRPIGFVRVPEGMTTERGLKILEAIQNGRIPAGAIEQFLDPLYTCRQIKDLIVIGPTELDKACRTSDGKNPLGLKEGWIPEIPVPDKLDQWIRSEKWRTDGQWSTRAVLVLMPPVIAGIPTSLIGQQKIWGIVHDGINPGSVRQDVFYSNWFVQSNYDWANIPAVTDWRWVLVYEHPRWTTNLNWLEQQRVAAERGMLISTAAQDVLALNLVLAATGTRLRTSAFSRTSTVFDGCPFRVDSDDNGVNLYQCWYPEYANGNVAVSVQGVPLDFVT